MGFVGPLQRQILESLMIFYCKNQASIAKVSVEAHHVHPVMWLTYIVSIRNCKMGTI